MADDGLPVEEAPRFEDRWAWAEAVLVGLMSLFVLAGVAGVFGRGPVSGARAVSQGGAAVLTYQRFLGAATPDQFALDLKATSRPSTATVFLDRPVLDHLVVTATRPRTVSETSSPNGTAFTFQVGPDGRGSIVFSVQPQKAGSVHGAFTVNGERMPINFIVWP